MGLKQLMQLLLSTSTECTKEPTWVKDLACKQYFKARDNNGFPARLIFCIVRTTAAYFNM